MTSPASGEFALIDMIRRRARARPGVPIGIGDDAALVRHAAGCDTLVTTDLLIDGVHFDLARHDPQLVGRKSLAVNLSDVAAMAGRPTAAFISLALPSSGGRRLVEALYRGIEELADEFDVAVAGGDTNSWDGPLVINVTLLAEPTGRGPAVRSGARVGDSIFVTGALGGSLAGRHLTFTPRVHEAITLHERVDLHSLIDLSDGLASDLRHILHASEVGALVEAAALPVSDDVDPHLPEEERVGHALGNGEDFELLFTVGTADARRLLDDPPVDVPLTRIGEVRAGNDCLLRRLDGSCGPLPQAGWQHRFDD